MARRVAAFSSQTRLKVAAGLVVSVSTIVGAAFAVDARYARAADIAALREGQSQLAKQTRDEVRYGIDMLRKQFLEDKMFEINLVPPEKRTDAQRALLERHRAQAQEINARWRAALDQ